MKEEGEDQDENIENTEEWVTKGTIHVYFVLL